MSTLQPGLTISAAARAAGVHVETLRYYQRLGLIEQPPKPLSGYRRYPPATIDRIRFIKRAQQLGFSLSEIAQLLQLEDGLGDASHCQKTRELAERKLQHIRQNITDLQAMATALHSHITDCCRNSADRPCPLIASLSQT